MHGRRRCCLVDRCFSSTRAHCMANAIWLAPLMHSCKISRTGGKSSSRGRKSHACSSCVSEPKHVAASCQARALVTHITYLHAGLLNGKMAAQHRTPGQACGLVLISASSESRTRAGNSATWQRPFPARARGVSWRQHSRHSDSGSPLWQSPTSTVPQSVRCSVSTLPVRGVQR